jgi:hypothetical protein
MDQKQGGSDNQCEAKPGRLLDDIQILQYTFACCLEKAERPTHP